MAPKSHAIKIGGFGEIQNVGVPAHKVVRSSGNREIDIWLILGIPFVGEYAGDIRNDQGLSSSAATNRIGLVIIQWLMRDEGTLIHCEHISARPFDQILAVFERARGRARA